MWWYIDRYNFPKLTGSRVAQREARRIYIYPPEVSKQETRPTTKVQHCISKYAQV
jgi:hypothetical protein